MINLLGLGTSIQLIYRHQTISTAGHWSVGVLLEIQQEDSYKGYALCLTSEFFEVSVPFYFN